VELSHAAEILYRLTQEQLSPEATFEVAERQVQSAAKIASVTPDVVEEVLARFRKEFKETSLDSAPRLLVDWGEIPQVGHQVRPEFSLICPSYSTRPEIMIRVDRELDHDQHDPRRRPQQEETGLWLFHVPFRMTTSGMDCSPGQYLIDIDVAFRDVPKHLPRFFRFRIRLKVPSSASVNHGVLEIDGDGQSVVNLQGCNLKQFSKVILKGGQDSIINLQNSLTSVESPPPVFDRPITTFEYQLKVDSEKQARLPMVLSVSKPRAHLETGAFFFEDERRTIVIARPQITFGRSRDNHVVLRFLPSNEVNDNHSRNISRTHFIAELTPEGVEIKDESRSGMELNYGVVKERVVIPSSHTGDVQHLEVGVTGVVSKKFELELTLFAPERRDHRDELQYWDELYCEVLGGRLSRIAREGLEVMLNAVRYDRINNLPGKESYVHFFREALVGNSPTQCAIVLREKNNNVPQARLLHVDRTFWLERLPGAEPIEVDGVALGVRQLAALSPGTKLVFGKEIATFDRPRQIDLD
jgi:hypothetical protein